MKEVDDSNRKNGVGVDLSDERCLQTSEGFGGRKVRDVVLKTLNINVNNSSIIINII